MKIPLLKVYAGASCLAAFVFWVWAIVNTSRSGFPDAGVVTFLLVLVANSFLYRDRVVAAETDNVKEVRNGAVVTQLVTPVPNCLTTCVTASGFLVALNYLGGLALALGLIEPPPPGGGGGGGDESPDDDIEMGIGFAVYCGIFAAGWTVWTILGLRWMRATTATATTPAVATDSKAAAVVEDREENADDAENV